MLNVYKDYGASHPALQDDGFLTKVGSLAAIMNTMRFVWSGAMDLDFLKTSPFKIVYGF